MRPSFSRRIVATCFLCSLAACAGADGRVITTSTAAPNSQSAECGASALGVRVLDGAGHLANFDPASSRVSSDVALACPGGATCPSAIRGASRLSLALDRTGSVWLMSCIGELDRWDPGTGRCSATGLTAAALGFDSFTMTFARASTLLADAGATADSSDLLVVAGGSGVVPPIAAMTSMLGLVHLPGMQFERVAPLSGWPGLSGAPQGSAWAFFPPGGTSGAARVAALDLRTGAESLSVTPPPETWTATPASFVVFRGEGVLFSSNSPATTQVYRFSLTDGAVIGTATLTGREVLAAAASTCVATP